MPLVPKRVPLSDIEGAVAELRAELETLTGEEAERVRASALAAVTEWRWTQLGRPGSAMSRRTCESGTARRGLTRHQTARTSTDSTRRAGCE